MKQADRQAAQSYSNPQGLNAGGGLIFNEPTLHTVSFAMQAENTLGWLFSACEQCNHTGTGICEIKKLDKYHRLKLLTGYIRKPEADTVKHVKDAIISESERIP